jgi:hypothetical protein
MKNCAARDVAEVVRLQPFQHEKSGESRKWKPAASARDERLESLSHVFRAIARPSLAIAAESKPARQQGPNVAERQSLKNSGFFEKPGFWPVTAMWKGLVVRLQLFRQGRHARNQENLISTL